MPSTESGATRAFGGTRTPFIAAGTRGREPATVSTERLEPSRGEVA